MHHQKLRSTRIQNFRPVQLPENIQWYNLQCLFIVKCLKALFDSSQKPCKNQLASSLRELSSNNVQYLKALTASLRVGFCDEWKRGLTHFLVLPWSRLSKAGSELQKVFNLPPYKISSFQIFLKIMRIKAFKLQHI